jgi:LmbE family N-acetylglucosaminyl deacetylase
MSICKNNRRKFMQQSATGLGMLSLPALLNAQVTNKKDKKKIVCVGGHPDDPESGCGGTLAKFANAGHDVTIIYLTTGEAGIEGKSHDEAATIENRKQLMHAKY